MYEACLFDYGNTLIEFDRRQIQGIEEKFREELSRRFGPVPLEDIHGGFARLYKMPRTGPNPSYRELNPVEQMGILLDDLYGRDSRSPGVISAANDALQELFLQSISMAEEDRLLLQRLSEKLPLGLVSNYPCGRTIRRSLERVGIQDFFRTVVISGEVGYVKPHPSMFRRAMSAVGTDPRRTLFVGDLWDADLCGARDAGLRTCHMVGFTTREDFEELYSTYRPDHIARSLGDVASILAMDPK